MKTSKLIIIYSLLVSSLVVYANDRSIGVPYGKKYEINYFHKHWKESIDVVDELIKNPHCACSGVEIMNAIEFLEFNTGLKVKLDAGFAGLLLVDVDEVIVKWKAWYDKNKMNIYWEGKFCVLGVTCKTDINTARKILELER